VVVVILAASVAIAVVAVVATIGSSGDGADSCGESAGHRNRKSFTVCARQHTSKNCHVALWVYLHACSQGTYLLLGSRIFVVDHIRQHRIVLPVGMLLDPFDYALEVVYRWW